MIKEFEVMRKVTESAEQIDKLDIGQSASTVDHLDEECDCPECFERLYQEYQDHLSNDIDDLEYWNSEDFANEAKYWVDDIVEDLSMEDRTRLLKYIKDRGCEPSSHYVENEGLKKLWYVGDPSNIFSVKKVPSLMHESKEDLSKKRIYIFNMNENGIFNYKLEKGKSFIDLPEQLELRSGKLALIESKHWIESLKPADLDKKGFVIKSNRTPQVFRCSNGIRIVSDDVNLSILKESTEIKEPAKDSDLLKATANRVLNENIDEDTIAFTRSTPNSLEIYFYESNDGADVAYGLKEGIFSNDERISSIVDALNENFTFSDVLFEYNKIVSANLKKPACYVRLVECSLNDSAS